MYKMIRIATFDIGKKNFAFVVQEIEETVLATLDKTNLDEVFAAGKIILFENIDLTTGCKKDCYLDPKTFINMTDVLDSFASVWDTCESFVIEQQMSFGKKHNTMALKLGQHCYSYFCIKYRDFKDVLEFPSYHKTKALNAPRKFGKIKKTYKNGKTKLIQDNHKKWSIRMAEKILRMRKDDVHLAVLMGMKKKDDVSDCLLMVQAYLIKFRI